MSISDKIFKMIDVSKSCPFHLRDVVSGDKEIQCGVSNTFEVISINVPFD